MIEQADQFCHSVSPYRRIRYGGRLPLFGGVIHPSCRGVGHSAIPQVDSLHTADPGAVDIRDAQRVLNCLKTIYFETAFRVQVKYTRVFS